MTQVCAPPSTVLAVLKSVHTCTDFLLDFLVSRHHCFAKGIIQVNRINTNQQTWNLLPAVKHNFGHIADLQRNARSKYIVPRRKRQSLAPVSCSYDFVHLVSKQHFWLIKIKKSFVKSCSFVFLDTAHFCISKSALRPSLQQWETTASAPRLQL